MKRTTGLLAGLLLYAGSFAQSVEQSKLKVTFGPTFAAEKYQSNLGILGKPEEGVVYITEDNTTVKIQKLSPAFAVTSTEVIKIKDLGPTARSGVVRKVGDKAYWFYSNSDKKGEKLFAVSIDPRTGKRAEPKLLVDKPKLAWYPTDDGIMYDVSISSDSSKILVAFRYPGKTSDDKLNYDQIGLQVYDADFNPLWNKDVTLPYTEVIMDNKEFGVDKAGNAYLLARVFDNSDRQEKLKDGKPGYHYELMRMEQSASSVKKQPIKLGKFISSEKLMESPAGGMVVVGYYSEYPNRRTSNGVFVIRTDKEGNLTKDKSLYEFSSEVLKQANSIPAEDGVNLIALNDVILHKDGSLLVAGQGFTTKSNNNYTVNYYGDIVLTKIGANKDEEWSKVIRKYQVGATTTESMGLGVVPYKNSYYVFYTDDPTNFTKSPTDKLASLSGWGGTLVYNKVDAGGKMNKQQMFEFASKKARMRPEQFGTSDGETIITRGFIDDTQRIVTIKLED